MVPVRGLFETHLTVRDLDRSVAFYRDVVGLQPAHVIPERRVAVLWIGAPGRAMLGLWSIHTSPIGLRLHVPRPDVDRVPYSAWRRSFARPAAQGGKTP
jgi:lactoylglutathione lyase